MEDKSIKGWTVHFTKNFGKDNNEEIIHHSKLEDYWEAKKEAIKKLKLFPNDGETISDEFNIKFDKIVNLDNDETRVSANPQIYPNQEFYTTKKINKYYHLFYGEYEHKKFILFDVFFSWIALIVLGFLLYYLNSNGNFGIFDNIKFILVFIFVDIAILIIILFIYGWFYTDVLDEDKKKLYSFTEKFLSFINFFKNKWMKIRSGFGAIFSILVFLFLVYLGATYLIGFF